jgi:multiple sugar transport system permease protein
LSNRTSSLKRRKGRLKKAKLPISAKVMLLPSVITLFVIGIFPLLFAVWVSTRQYELSKPYEEKVFLGVQNYITVLSDPEFWTALKITFTFFIIALPIQLFLGTLIALFVYGLKLPWFAAITRVVLVLPIAVTPTITGLLGRLLFNSDFGLINYGLSFFGIPPIQWLAEQKAAFVAIIILDTWQWTPFVALVLLASLMVIPPHILEAGRLDGGTGWKIFRHMQLPYLLPGFTALLILRTADILKMYDTIYAFSKGGPGVATELITLYINRIGFGKVFNVGLGATQSILLLIICIVLSRTYIRLFYRDVEA